MVFDKTKYVHVNGIFPSYGLSNSTSWYIMMKPIKMSIVYMINGDHYNQMR